MTTYSRSKGRVGEQEVLAILKAHGLADQDAELSWERKNGAEDVPHLIPGTWLEVCRAERMNLTSKFRQAVNAAQRDGHGFTPWLVHRTNRQPWLVTMHLEDALVLVQWCARLYPVAED